jgi:hypothetical protein
VVIGKADIQLTYELPAGMTHDAAVNALGSNGLTNLLLGVGVQGKLAVQMSDATPAEIAEVQIIATADGMKLFAAVNLEAENCDGR